MNEYLVKVLAKCVEHTNQTYVFQQLLDVIETIILKINIIESKV